MDTNTYGFIVHVPDTDRSNFYSETEENGRLIAVCGAADDDVALAAAEWMASEKGIETIDLCEDFHNTAAKNAAKVLAGKASVKSAVFDESQKANMDKVDWYRYGVLVLDEKLTPNGTCIRLQSADIDLRLVGVSCEEEALAQIRQLMAEGFECFCLSRGFGRDGSMKLIHELDELNCPYLLESVGLDAC